MAYPRASLPPNPTMEPWIETVERLTLRARRHVLNSFKPEPMSQFLYKYLPCNTPHSTQNLNDVIVGSVLRLSSPRDFNDPFELAAHFVMDATDDEKSERYETLVREQAPHLGSRARQAHVDTLMAATWEQLSPTWQRSLRSIRDTAGVYCFAGKARNRLMWGHYASNHKGVCLQFERVLDIRTFCHALRVRYSPQLPIVNWVVGFHNDIGNMLFSKDPCWQYEQESRIQIPGQAGRYLAFEPQALRRLIFGCKAEVDFIDSVEMLLDERRRAGMPPVDVFVSRQHPTRYHLSVFRR
jgi:hypothetical protein